jgi:hypothetical protein
LHGRTHFQTGWSFSRKVCVVWRYAREIGDENLLEHGCFKSLSVPERFQAQMRV